MTQSLLFIIFSIYNPRFSSQSSLSVLGIPSHQQISNRSVLDYESEQLSQRELDVIKLAAKGLTNKDIATKLHLSYRTVEGHMRDIFNKLGVGSRTEAVLYGLKKGWFSLDELV